MNLINPNFFSGSYQYQQPNTPFGFRPNSGFNSGYQLPTFHQAPFAQQLYNLIYQLVSQLIQQPRQLTGTNGNDFLRGGFGNDVLSGLNGNDTLFGGFGHDVLNPGNGQNRVFGGAGHDLAEFAGRPIDYKFDQSQNGNLQVTQQADMDNQSLLNSVEGLRFLGADNQTFSSQQLANNPFLTDRRDISIYGDPENNRLLVMKLSSFENLAEIPIDGESVYSVDYVTDDKSYVIPRGSNFIQVLDRSPTTGQFVPGEKVELPFAPRTPNRNDNNGLTLFSGSDKPMFALIDSETNEVVATGGRNEFTQDGIENFDSRWATGHAQWINDSQFLLPDRESKEVSLYQVTKEGDSWEVEKQDSLIAPGSIHTFFGSTTDENGVITTYAPGEGTDANNNTDANLFELKVANGELSINRQVNVSGGLHHPGIHPDGDLIYTPTSNGKVDIIDRNSFEVVKQIDAGKGAGHVVFVPERNLALIVNHEDTFMTAIDIRTHEKIKDFTVAGDDPNVDSSLQSHTGRLSPDKQYFYNFASETGTFFRVNLDTLEMDRQLYTGGTPKQATQPGELR